MTNENQAEIFIHLLAEALEADRMIRKASLSVRSKASVEKFKQLFLSDLDYAMNALGPLERGLPQMAAKTHDLRIG